MIGSQLLRYKTDQSYLCFDTETEGLNLGFHRPFQIAWLIFKDKQILETGNYYIKWDDLEVSKTSAIHTRFNEKNYKQSAKPADEVLKIFEERLQEEKHIVIGHNLLFDRYMYTNWRKNLGLKENDSWLNRLIDTNILAKAIKKQFQPPIFEDRENYLIWQWKVHHYVEKGLKSSLGLVCKENDIEYREDKAHDALYDVTVNMHAFNALKWKIEI